MSELDKIDLLRTLVINENLPGIDYMAHRFSFRTVFKRESYTYCCCNCAFEHEYMLYISDKGQIIKEIFDRVVQNISLGECSHVKDVSEEFVTETSVGAIHIVAARGDKTAAEGHWVQSGYYLDCFNLYEKDTFSNTGIFELLPYDIAALKGQRLIMKIYMTMTSGPQVPFIRFWDKDRAIFSVQTVFRQNISQCITNTNPRACPRFQPEFRSRPGTLVQPAIDSMLKVRPINDVIMVREKVAIMIYENPDLNLHNKSVRRALKRDVNFQGRSALSRYKSDKLSGKYKADAKEHGIFGYDADTDFSLNFMGPFLMECGFPVDRKEIEYLVEHEQVPPFCLHKAVIEYVHSFLENPRPLIAMCRDTLRRHFKGRAIHGYVELVNCPVKIKDIILMKTILNYEGGNVVP